jgi:hypothetical protein
MQNLDRIVASGNDNYLRREKGEQRDDQGKLVALLNNIKSRVIYMILEAAHSGK